MDVRHHHPAAVLYGLSVLDPINQLAFAVLRDVADRPKRYGTAAKRLAALGTAGGEFVDDLEERARMYESLSGAPGELLPPLAVAEFSWRDAALAVARSDPGPAREVAVAAHDRTAATFRAYLESVSDQAAAVLDPLISTFDAAAEILAATSVAKAFGAKPLPRTWLMDDRTAEAPARLLSAISEELQPEPFGRLSTYEVQLLKHLAIARRSAVQLLLEQKFDPVDGSSAVVAWSQALSDFQLASVARATRGQTTLVPDDPRSTLNDRRLGFLPSRVLDFLGACASGGT